MLRYNYHKSQKKDALNPKGRPFSTPKDIHDGTADRYGAHELNISRPHDAFMTDEALERLFFPKEKSAINKRVCVC